MNRSSRILTIVLVALIVIAAIGYGYISFWMRAGRLGPDACMELLVQAHSVALHSTPSGTRMYQYRIGEALISEPVDDQMPLRYAVSEYFMDFLYDSPGEFHRNITVSHAGRRIIAGHVCEGIRVKPSQYNGYYTELWLDDATSHILRYARYTDYGTFSRGYEFTDVEELPEGREESLYSGSIDEFLVDYPFIGPVMAGNVDKNLKRAADHKLAYPEHFPDGFRLIGARVMGVGQQLMRMMQGSMNMPRPPVAQAYSVFSDGLNTITVLQIPLAGHQPGNIGPGITGSGMGPGAGGLSFDFTPDPNKIDQVLRFKEEEMQRIFHISMSHKILDNAVIILLGEVSQQVLDTVAESIPDVPVVPAPEMLIDIPKDMHAPPDLPPEPQLPSHEPGDFPGFGQRPAPGNTPRFPGRDRGHGN